jgi:serine/threonine protein phosphatase 1
MPLRIANLFRRKRPVTRAAAPAGTRIYAIGDIHGRQDLLEEISALISDDLVDAPSDVLTIFLGDYIDRGPHSSQIIETLAQRRFPTPFHALRGNHEKVILDFLEHEGALESWRNFGGLETLHSYGVNVASVMRGEGYGAAREALIQNLPNHHRAFFENTKLSLSFGDYFFCHAGVRPGTPLVQQSAEDLLWIREDFLVYDGYFDKTIVHGHTPVSAPEIKPNRINVDTGAYATSVLTAVVLEGSERRFLFAGNAQSISR